MKKIPVVVSIDVEPDEREITGSTGNDWPGFEETVEFFSELRPRLEKATASPVYFSWFFRMDPQVEHTYGVAWWVAGRYREIIRRLQAAGDELGLHTHAWRWDDDLHRWLADHGNQQWIDHCVKGSLDAYRHAFGRSCRCFRFGDHWMNDATMALMESLGVEFDLTIEPGVKAKPALAAEDLHTGSLPDYTAAPRWPYRPSVNNFRKSGGALGRGLWVLPLSTGRSRIGRFPALKRAAMALGTDLQRRYETTPLFLTLETQRFRGMTNDLLGVWRKRYLAPVVRTDAGVNTRYKDNMQQNMQFLLSHALVNRLRFVKPPEAVDLLSS